MPPKQHVRYHFVQVEPRKKLGIGVLEYCLADAIYHLSTNPSAAVQGWCYASKSYFADLLDISNRSVYNLLTNLLKKGLIEKNPETAYLKTTQKWYDSVVIFSTERIADPMQILHTPMQKLQNTTAKIADNNKYNNKNNIISKKPIKAVDNFKKDFNKTHSMD